MESKPETLRTRPQKGKKARLADGFGCVLMVSSSSGSEVRRFGALGPIAEVTCLGAKMKKISVTSPAAGGASCHP